SNAVSVPAPGEERNRAMRTSRVNMDDLPISACETPEHDPLSTRRRLHAADTTGDSAPRTLCPASSFNKGFGGPPWPWPWWLAGPFRCEANGRSKREEPSGARRCPVRREETRPNGGTSSPTTSARERVGRRGRRTTREGGRHETPPAHSRRRRRARPPPR